jgi:hypothetical protein
MANDNDNNNDGFQMVPVDFDDAELGIMRGEGVKVLVALGPVAVPVDCNSCPKVDEVQGRFQRSEDQLTACCEQVSLFEGERTQAEANAARLFQELVDVRTKLAEVSTYRESLAVLVREACAERDEIRLELQRAQETVASCGEAREALGRMSQEVVRVCKENLESDEKILRWEHWSDTLYARYLLQEPEVVTSIGKRVGIARLLGSLSTEVGEWRAWAGGILAAHSVSSKGDATAEELQIQLGEVMGGLVQMYQEQLAEAESERDEANARTARAESALEFLQQNKDNAVEELKRLVGVAEVASTAREEWRRCANTWQQWAVDLCKNLKFFLVQDGDLGDSLMRAHLSGYIGAVSMAEDHAHEWRQSAFDWYNWGSALMLANGLAASGEMVGATEMRKRIGDYVPFLKQQLMCAHNDHSTVNAWSSWVQSILEARGITGFGGDYDGSYGREVILELIEKIEGDLHASEEYGASESARADSATEQCEREKAARLYALNATALSLYRVVCVLQKAQQGPEDINSMTVKDLVTRLARKLIGIDAAVKEIGLLMGLIHPESEPCGIEAIFAAAPPDQEIPGPCPELRTEPSNEPPGLWSLDDATLQAMGEEETKPGMTPSIEEPDFEGTRIGIGPELPMEELDDLLEADDEPEHQPKIHERPLGLKSGTCESAQLNPLSVLDDRTDLDESGAQAGGQDYGTAEHHRAPFWGTLPGSGPIDSKQLGNETPSTREGGDLIMRSFGAQSETEPETAVISTGFFGCCQNKAIRVESETAGSPFSADQAFRVTGECPTCFELWGNYCDCECQGKPSSGEMCVWGWVAGCQETGQVSSHRCKCSPNTRLAELVRMRLVCVGSVSLADAAAGMSECVGGEL